MRFNQSEIRVTEGAGTVQIVVEVIPEDVHNLNSADLKMVEDRNKGSCLEPGW